MSVFRFLKQKKKKSYSQSFLGMANFDGHSKVSKPTFFMVSLNSEVYILVRYVMLNLCYKSDNLRKIRAVAGQRSSPDLCFVTTSVKIYDP